MAINILLIPTISADPERLFLGAKITITDRRNRLGIKTIKALECLKSWIGILEQESDKPEDKNNEVIEQDNQGDNNNKDTVNIGQNQGGDDDQVATISTSGVQSILGGSDVVGIEAILLYQEYIAKPIQY